MSIRIVTAVILSAFISTGVSADEQSGPFFELADRDASQSLSMAEFENYINLLADEGKKGARVVRALRIYSAAWSNVNKNGDAFVSNDEIAAAATEHHD